MSKPSELIECAECGVAIVNTRRHRRWHDTVVVTREVKIGRPAYLGDEIGDISDAYDD